MTELSSLSEILAASGDAAYDWDLRSDQIVWFGAFEKFFGRDTPPPGNSEKLYTSIYSEDRHMVFGLEEQVIDRQYRLGDAGGSCIWVHERGCSDSENGQVVRQRGILRFMDRVSEKNTLTEIQGRDALTGCFDRGYIQAQITKAMDESRTSRRTFAYLVIGIDKMSFVNAAVGMEAGDALLRGVSERLAQIMPTRAILARVGGDMFGIMLPRPLGDEAKVVAEHILQSFRDQPVVTSVTPLHITVSIGAIRLPTIAKNATEAMIFAEQALHDAHQRGRNLFTEYLDQPERTQGNRELLELGERIKYAFKHDGFRLAYQPIVNAATGRTECYEALVRMFADDGSPISAALFVPAIEQLGLAYELDCLVLDMAVREMESYPDIRVAINISGLTASRADWTDHMISILESRPLVTRRIIVEITETAALVDIDETRRFAESLCRLGGQVSLDDFGAGSTSIRYLRSLSLSIMKIDKELLQNILVQPEQQHLVRMLIELARGLGLKTVAEGIETEDMAKWLRDARVDMMQGYYFGKPTLTPPWADKGKAITESAITLPKTKDQNLNTSGTTGLIRAAAFI